MSPPPKSPLSPARRRLIALLQAIHFGRILDLHVQDGQPLFDEPPPKVIRTIKLAGTSQLRPSTTAIPKREIIDQFEVLDSLGTGVIGRIEIAHGVPLFAEVHESPPAS